jgi:putative transcriptional regulator
MKNIIREIRTEKGLRQEDLGEQIGVSRQTINAIEKGKFDPSLSTAFKLSKELGLKIEELFQFEESGPK